MARELDVRPLRPPLIDLARLSPAGPDEAVPPYRLLPAYTARERPEYYEDPKGRWFRTQPDVYRFARQIAAQIRVPRVVDIGCGNGAKLAPIAEQFHVVGIDYGPNLDKARRLDVDGTWLEANLESDCSFIPDSAFEGAVVICADVIEHLSDPSELLRLISRAAARSACVLVSTPERVRTRGEDHLGPSPNPCHVREWSQREFAALLVDHDIRNGVVTLTRSHNFTFARSTILAALWSSPPISEVRFTRRHARAKVTHRKAQRLSSPAMTMLDALPSELGQRAR